ncbi:EF-HAND PAIR PROTEIN [Salix viminalis]|uniref:EF-HAND PAIR PROTEIN n=1 Tax=Salix viminalis TaxID=40686 RepID=A0A9Q0SGC4_SALVM|nr:EF-HAND PAIR PROTEIN [Salix viminalis]
MAIKSCRLSVDGKRVMSIEEFKRWLKTFDADKDGRISREELEDAMPGGWFTRWKGKRGIRSADSDGNGFIEESEINNLVELAQKYLGPNFANGFPQRRIPTFSFGLQRSLLNYITEAGRLSAPAKSEAKSMFLTEEQLKEVFKRFEAIEEPVLHREDLEKAFNHFGLFFPHHVATVFDAKKEGCC